MTIRNLGKNVKELLVLANARLTGPKELANDTLEIVGLLHQRMTLMEKIHDFRIHPGGPSYLDVEPEVIEKMSTSGETEDGNGKSAQHDKS